MHGLVHLLEPTPMAIKFWQIKCGATHTLISYGNHVIGSRLRGQEQSLVSLLYDLIGNAHCSTSQGMMYARELTSRIYIDGGVTTKDGRGEASDLRAT